MSAAVADPDRFDPVLFTAENLSFSHPGRELLSGLSFTIRPGLTLVRGGDGRGKTTLLQLIAGSLAPGGGWVHRSADNVIHENPADPLHDEVVVRDWLALRQQRFAGWRPELEACLIDAFGLAEHLHKPMYMLSTGSRRKVGLVAAAASGAALTLVDTPFAALDARSCQVVSDLLSDAAEDRTRAWVIADYELPAGLRRADLSGLIDLGD